MMRLSASILFLIMISFASSARAHASDWTLEAEQSRVSFATIKAGDIAENHHFKSVSGTVADDGSIDIRINLASVETNIDIRNERMRAFLFETEKFAQATVSAKIPDGLIGRLGTSSRTVQTLGFTLDLHGIRQEIEADLYITKLADGRILVETTEPVLVHADDFGLLGGVNKLMELAGLDAITPVVPVTASLVFTPK